MARQHIAAPGESIDTIAERYGLAPEPLWQHNAELRQRRRNRNTLEPGDVVSIPDVNARQVKVATGRRHRFRRKGVPWKLKLRLVDGKGPRKSTKYTIELDDGTLLEGKTDDQGVLERFVPVGAKEGTLRIGQDEYVLRLSRLPPSDSVEGVRARLVNLGLLHPSADTEAVSAALALFQRQNELTDTGQLDDETRQKLELLHGC